MKTKPIITRNITQMYTLAVAFTHPYTAAIVHSDNIQCPLLIQRQHIMYCFTQRLTFKSVSALVVLSFICVPHTRVSVIRSQLTFSNLWENTHTHMIQIQHAKAVVLKWPTHLLNTHEQKTTFISTSFIVQNNIRDRQSCVTLANLEHNWTQDKAHSCLGESNTGETIPKPLYIDSKELSTVLDYGVLCPQGLPPQAPPHQVTSSSQ